MPVRWLEMLLLPTVEATAADAKATVQVEQASAENNGVATVTVTAEDGTAKTYMIVLGICSRLTSQSQIHRLVLCPFRKRKHPI